MITNKGKSVISKYLVGQTTSYASYLAIGCGAVPLKNSDTLVTSNYSTKDSLGFEMFRVPIISRGYITENGQQKIVLTAELPAEERYEITEIGLYPAQTNPVANNNDSKMLYAFSQNEQWEYHSDTGNAIIPVVTTKLNTSSDIDVAATETGGKAFQANSNNLTFSEPTRITRLETPRFMNSSIIVRGDMSGITTSSGRLAVASASSHLHINNINLDLSRNASLDKLKVAFSIINRKGAGNTDTPHSVRLIVEFATDDTSSNNSPSGYARAEIDIAHSTTPNGNQQNFASNRYVVKDILLKDLYTYGSFSWNSVKYVRVFAAVFANSTTAGTGVGSSDYYVALDGIRLENLTSLSALYGLTGYTVLKNDVTYSGTTSPIPVSKQKDQSGFIEFRFVADVI